jgi:predicted HTH domain antitoxin
MQITVDLPKHIAQRPDPAREALEALAIEGYRCGALTSFETQRWLGFESRYELDGFLRAHNVWEHAYSTEDFERDCETLQELEDKHRDESERPACSLWPTLHL